MFQDVILYLARTNEKGRTRYSIRQSYHDGDCYRSRQLVDLGFDPRRYIIYPSSRSYYYDLDLIDALAEAGMEVGQDELDTIFFDFLDPEIQRVITGFDRNWQQGKKPGLEPKVQGGFTIHIFDKRRHHFLRFGDMNQQSLAGMPEKYFAHLAAKSRDELEQHFMAQEMLLPAKQKMAYVFTIFDLKQFFTSPRARVDPSSVNQQRLDRFFMDRLCGLNEDHVFWSGMPAWQGLHPYLIRYAITFFDTSSMPSRRPAWIDEMEDFINSHRRYTPPRKVQMKMDEAARLFSVPWKELRKMSRKELSRRYRKLALKHHPDQGGDEGIFRRLTEVYKALLRRKR